MPRAWGIVVTEVLEQLGPLAPGRTLWRSDGGFTKECSFPELCESGDTFSFDGFAYLVMRITSPQQQGEQDSGLQGSEHP